MSTNGRIPTPGETTLGAVSMRCGHDPEANWKQYLAFIDEAALRGVDYLVFPEVSLQGYLMGSRVLGTRDMAEQLSYFRRVAEPSANAARGHSSGHWWSESGVHQNITFPVHPDPMSGMHCWHQRVRVQKADAADRFGDIVVDRGRARAVLRSRMSVRGPSMSMRSIWPRTCSDRPPTLSSSGSGRPKARSTATKRRPAASQS